MWKSEEKKYKITEDTFKVQKNIAEIEEERKKILDEIGISRVILQKRRWMLLEQQLTKDTEIKALEVS